VFRPEIVRVDDCILRVVAVAYLNGLLVDSECVFTETAMRCNLGFGGWARGSLIAAQG
jgi:hypothetical protein